MYFLVLLIHCYALLSSLHWSNSLCSALLGTLYFLTMILSITFFSCSALLRTVHHVLFSAIYRTNMLRWSDLIFHFLETHFQIVLSSAFFSLLCSLRYVLYPIVSMVLSEMLCLVLLFVGDGTVVIDCSALLWHYHFFDSGMYSYILHFLLCIFCVCLTVDICDW